MSSSDGKSASGQIIKILEVPYERAVNAVYGMDRDSKGRLYVAFSGAIEGHKPPLYRAVVTRLDANNNLDKNYGDLGFATVDFFDILGLGTQSMVVQEEGSVVLIAHDPGSRRAVAGLVKFDTNGHLDQTFGDGGTVVHRLREFSGDTEPVTYTNIEQDDSQNSRLASTGHLLSLPSGALIYCDEFTSPKGENLLAIAKFTSNGSLDGAFGQNGVTEISPPHEEVRALQASTIAELSDGRIVVCGSAYLVISPDVLTVQGWICRCSPEGDLDNTFGDQGHLILEFPEGVSNKTSVRCEAVAQGPDFSLACVATLTLVESDAPLNIYSQISYLDQSGADAYSFNAGKPVIFDVIGHNVDFLSAVAVSSDNKIVVAGQCITYADTSVSHDMLVARFNFDGSRDTSFAGQGWLAESYKGGGNRLGFIMLGKQSIVVLGENRSAAIIMIVRA